MGCLLDGLQEAGHWSAVLEWGEKWIAFGQKPEAAYRYLMSAYAAQGDMAKAALTFERCAKSLAELGVEPSEQTRGLYNELKTRKQASRVPSYTRSLAERPRSTSNLPIPLTTFIGRERK